MNQNYREGAEKYLNIQADILRDEAIGLDSLDDREISPIISRTIPISRQIVRNMGIYRKAEISESVIENYLSNLEKFKKRAIILMQS